MLLLKIIVRSPGLVLTTDHRSLITDHHYCDLALAALPHSLPTSLHGNYSPCSTPYRIAASRMSMFISFSVLNLMQYPLTLALPIFFPYVSARYFLSLRPRI